MSEGPAEIYNQAFYEDQASLSRQSADVVVPMLDELLHPSSVLDVGCGIGTWLAVWANNGISDYLGLDGNIAYESLVVPRSHIQTENLERSFDLGRRFDLVVSLEVAEHLNRDAADMFVESLARHSDAVLFSAAAPGQGGVHHINEQWPSFWAARFSERGLTCFDVLRRRIWSDDRVAWWYAQNTLLYATGEIADKLSSAGLEADPEMLDIGHPHFREPIRDPSFRHLLNTLGKDAEHLARAFAPAISRRLGASNK